MTQTTTTAPPPTGPPPPSPPRDINARARRRAWDEAPVRLWWLSAIVIGLIAVYFAVTQLADALADRRLIEQGTQVDAEVLKVDGSNITRPMKRDVERLVTLRFTLPDGRAVETGDHRLSPDPDAYVRVGTKIPIRVDPTDPTRWTDRTRPKPWLAELTAVALLLPLVALLLLVAFVRRAAALKIWRDAPAAEAVVVAVAHSAMAPRSRVLRLTLRGDSRVFTTLYPLRGGLPAVGETIWVVAPTGKPNRAVVARLYE